MGAKHILAILSVVFLIAALVRLARDAGTLHPQSKTWLLISVIFGAVSAWLFYRQ